MLPAMTDTRLADIALTTLDGKIRGVRGWNL